MANLPDSVRAKARFSPAENVALAILKHELSEVDSGADITMRQAFPFIQVRRLDSFGSWAGDPRFLDDAYIGIYCFVEDPDGDEDAAILSEAVRVVFDEASVNKYSYPGIGSVVNIAMESAPHRTPDWSTSSGPVQYADLPAGVWRYEAEYTVTVRRPRSTNLS